MSLQREAIVRPDPANPRRGRLRVADVGDWACALGRSGVRLAKREGDGATPVGSWPIRHVLHRSDRQGLPGLAYPASSIRPDDGWCDAPIDRNYNRKVTLPYPASAERMWRDDGVYDVVVVLGHNDDPPIPGLGSAIFMHIARPGLTATEGCIALALPDLLAVLTCDPPVSHVRVLGEAP